MHDLLDDLHRLFTDPRDQPAEGMLREIVRRRLRPRVLVARVYLADGRTLKVFEGSQFTYRFESPAEAAQSPPTTAVFGTYRGTRGTGPWKLRLICCGREDGAERFETWEEADAFRESYTRKLWPYDHDRVAILARVEEEA